MYARVAAVHVQVSKLDDAIRVYQEGVVPALQTQPGFVGVELLVNRETGHGISITRWESREAQLASEQSGFYRDQVGRFRGLFDALPVREIYDVVVKEDAPVPSVGAAR